MLESAAKAAINEQKLMARRDDFLRELSQYVTEYGEQTVTAFADYWTEPNRSCTKMRYELQPTWNTAMRLATWSRREKPTQQASSGSKLAPKEALRRMVEKMSNNTQTAIEL